jgi:hypothetical protein
MRTRSLVVLAAAVAISFGVALPAQAATSGASLATLTVPGGVLTITVTPYPGSLGYQADPSGHSVSGLLGQVHVDDARNAAAGSGWTASVVSTAFVSASGAAIPASAISYLAGPITKVGTATYTANNPLDLTAVVPVVTATGITGDNSASWNPTIIVKIPADMTAGIYAATVTHSVV